MVPQGALFGAMAIGFPFQYAGPGAYIFEARQPGTITLYQAQNTGVDYMFVLETNGTIPPLPPGYQQGPVTGYVYPTQICGSVPLYHLYNPQVVDHFYTIDEAEKQDVILWGNYTDQGILAYVLPLSTGEHTKLSER